jgi:hypothetical protein
MQLSNFSHRPLIGAAAIACAAALMPSAALAAATARAAPAGAGNPATVPAGFRPSSASFYSPASGVVLGGAGCLYGKPCKARLAATTDSGARWSFLKAPDVQVTQVTFADRRNGWLYGPTGRYDGRGLWATHDRGAHWRKLSVARGVIDSMAASAGTAYAVVTPPGGKPDELFASPVGRDAWARVGHLTARFGILAVSGRAAWFGNRGGSIDGSSPYVWATTDGARWHKYPVRCPAPYNFNGLASIAAATPSDVFFLCLSDAAAGQQGKAVLRSVNGGRTTHLAGTPPTSGPGGVIALPPRRPQVITLGTEFFLDRSGDGGKTWTAKAADGGGAPWNSLSYLSRTAGWAEFGSAPYSGLLRTTNAGVIWHQVSFARAPAPASHDLAVPAALQSRAGTWTKLPAAPIAKSPNGGVVSVWTGHEMIIHGINFRPAGGFSGVTFAYRPATRRWVRLANGPSSRSAFETNDVAVWTGSRMLVPGQTRAIYNPATDTWREMPPPPMSLSFAVTGWTGRRFLAWGGTCCEDTSHDGVVYDPASNTWRTLPAAPLSVRRNASGAWTGRELVVAGGFTHNSPGGIEMVLLRDAAAYNPATGKWRKIAPMPKREYGATAVWDGSEILFIGGTRAGVTGPPARGLAYNPSTNRWRLLSAMAYPRDGFAAVWTGRQLLVWGGLTAKGVPPAYGEAYTPATGKWTALPASPLRGRTDPVAVWTGRQMIVWGGGTYTDGAAYMPATR